MKTKFMYLLGVLLIGGSITFTSCTKDDDDPDSTQPTISLGTGAGFLSDDATIVQGSTFKVNIIAAKGSANLSEVTVFEDGVAINANRLTVDGSAATSNPIAVGAFDASALNWEIEVDAANTAATRAYRFQVQGADGLTSSVTITVTTTASLTTIMGVIFNADGPNLGGFDFSAGMSVGRDHVNADIRDRGIDGSSPATNWRQQIEPRNAATIRKAAIGVSFDATLAAGDILAAYTGAGADLTVSPKIQAGDIYIVRKNNEYYMVRFTDVNVTTNDNLDNYEIDIKY